MFRSLANFISHKRVYCQQRFNASIHFGFGNDGNAFSQDVTTIVQAEDDYLRIGNNGKHQEKDLSGIIERLAQQESTNRALKLNDFYEQVNKKLTQDELVQQMHVLQLEPDDEMESAVYQTLRTTENGSVKSELHEIDVMLRGERNVLGPDGKIMSLADLPSSNTDIARNFECEICKKSNIHASIDVKYYKVFISHLHFYRQKQILDRENIKTAYPSQTYTIHIRLSMSIV